MMQEFFIAIIFVFTVMNIFGIQSQKSKQNLQTYDDYVKIWKKSLCLFPYETLYESGISPEEHPILQPCKAVPKIKACEIFLKASLHLCAATKGQSKAKKKFKSKLDNHLLPQAKQMENGLCNLAQEKISKITNYISYMANTTLCENVCNNTKSMCALLVAAFCNYYDIKSCSVMSNSGHITVNNPINVSQAVSKNEGPLSSGLEEHEAKDIKNKDDKSVEGENLNSSIKKNIQGIPNSNDDEKDKSVHSHNNNEGDDKGIMKKEEEKNSQKKLNDGDNKSNKDSLENNSDFKTNTLKNGNNINKEEIHIQKDDSEKTFSEIESLSYGHFIAYFLTAVVLVVVGYVIFHNKQKIIACVVEDRKAFRHYQTHKDVKYSELES